MYGEGCARTTAVVYAAFNCLAIQNNYLYKVCILSSTHGVHQALGTQEAYTANCLNTGSQLALPNAPTCAGEGGHCSTAVSYAKAGHWVGIEPMTLRDETSNPYCCASGSICYCTNIQIQCTEGSIIS